MLQKKCNCCQKMRDLELEVARLTKEVELMKGKPKTNEIKAADPEAEMLAQTFLLDLSITEPAKLSLPSIADSINKVNAKLAMLESKCSLLPSLKESIFKQTAIIYYLEKKVEEVTSSNSQNLSNILKENNKMLTKKQSIHAFKSSPVRQKNSKSLLKGLDFCYE